MLELIVHVSVPLPPQGLTTVNHTDKTCVRSGQITDHLCELIQFMMCKVSFVGRGKMAKPDEGIPSCYQEHWGIQSGRPPFHSVKERSRHYIHDICGRFDHCTSCGKQCSVVSHGKCMWIVLRGDSTTQHTTDKNGQHGPYGPPLSRNDAAS